MSKKNNCNICAELAGVAARDTGSYREAVEAGENIILSSANFVVIPSVGPLNETHAMLVPRIHTNSFAALSPHLLSEAFDILETLRQYIDKSLQKNLIYFESGAGRLTSHAGGCISHAHIHCLSDAPAFERRLREEVDLKSVPKGVYTGADTEHGYIWFRNAIADEFICNRPLLPSQFLRYIYAQSTGVDSIWNWRKNANFEGIREVIRTYAKLAQSNGSAENN